MTSRLFCKIFVDSEGDKGELVKRVAASTGGRVDLGSVHTNWSVIDVLRNDEYDAAKKIHRDEGFLFFPFIIETEPFPEVARVDYLGRVGELITMLRNSGCTVVPACDFEDELPTL